MSTPRNRVEDRSGGRDVRRAQVSPFEHLHWTVDGGIATVTMDRPPVNAVNQQMYMEL